MARQKIRGAERLAQEDGRGAADRAAEARGKALALDFQLTVAPVCLTTLPHLSKSARMSLVSSSGGMERASTPPVRKLACSSLSCSALLISVYRRCTIGAGMPAGP